MIGYIDLLIKNKETGEIIIVDHKSKKKFSSKAEEKKYRKQLEFYTKSLCCVENVCEIAGH